MSNGALVVVDTMVVSALVNERRDPATATEYLKLIDARAVVISFVTVTEMRYGTLKANWGELRRRELERTLSRLVAVQPDDDLMTKCAELRDRCERDGVALARRSTKRIGGSRQPLSTSALTWYPMTAFSRTSMGWPSSAVRRIRTPTEAPNLGGGHPARRRAQPGDMRRARCVQTRQSFVPST